MECLDVAKKLRLKSNASFTKLGVESHLTRLVIAGNTRTSLQAVSKERMLFRRLKILSTILPTQTMEFEPVF